MGQENAFVAPFLCHLIAIRIEILLTSSGAWDEKGFEYGTKKKVCPVMKDSISVIIPAYNEESRIQPTIERTHSYLSEKFRDFEIIVVDDGSTDKTVPVVESLGRGRGNIRLIHYPENSGKGYAVKTGVLASRGDFLLTCDADQSTAIEELEKLFPFMEKGFDVVIGSRGLGESDIVVRQPWYRERMGKTFNMLVRALVIGGFKDTQCGFKLFSGDVARRLFRKSLISGFSFDVEILFLAKKEGFRIKEVPVKWLNSPNSRVRIVRDSAKMFAELFKIRAYWLSGKYSE
jgi:dolichyl-phosphate beta-glucosyltransferase